MKLFLVFPQAAGSSALENHVSVQPKLYQTDSPPETSFTIDDSVENVFVLVDEIYRQCQITEIAMKPRSS